MEVDQNVMLGCLLYNALLVVDHPLVLTIHEVNLHTLHAPLRVLGEDIVDMSVYSGPRLP